MSICSHVYLLTRLSACTAIRLYGFTAKQNFISENRIYMVSYIIFMTL
ncbi:hypothetical protein D083_0544 [Dickeya solani RNS 08.23.3.1.A]|nr:hypothetical protein D083_0544 [Dickeya solani RNS 08.23.3.1.A]